MDLKRVRKPGIAIAGAVAFFAVSSAAYSKAVPPEGNVVSGKVVDASTHNVIDAVRVTVEGTDLSGRTGKDGSFYLEKVSGEKVVLEMSRAGYKSREIEIQVTDAPASWTVALWKNRR